MFRSIANTFANCFKIPELKSRILFTVAVLAVCRFMAVCPMPGLDATELAKYFESRAGGGGAFGMYSMFTGGAFEHCALGALTIIPYISATIIIQLMTAVVPQLSKMVREEGGRAKIIQLGRYITVPLCLVQGMAMAIGWEHPNSIFQGANLHRLVLYPDSFIWWYRFQTVILLTTGTMLLMWLGEQITDRGIGNGVSLIITINILARLPAAFQGIRDMFFTGPPEQRHNIGHAIALVLLLAGVIAAVIAITQAQRKVPVQYAQRAVGRKVFQGGQSFMPLRVNYVGVMPIIFAQAILMFPEKIFQLLGGSLGIKLFLDLAIWLAYGSAPYLILYGLMILFFSYFWVATQFNELQIADDLKKNGGYIPGVRPGQATSNYLHDSMSRITLAGALFLTGIAVVPILLSKWMNVSPYVSNFFGGTSMLITVGVLLDTMRQMEAHLLMRHYDGFLKKGRLRGGGGF